MIYEFSTAPAALPRKTDLIRLAAIFVSCIFIKPNWPTLVLGWETVQLAQAGITGAPKGGFLGKQVSNTRSGKEEQTDQKSLHP